MVACLLDAVVGSAASGLPPPASTGALAAFERLLSAAPRLNRLGLRSVLWAVELGALGAAPAHRRLSRLPGREREAYLGRVERLPAVKGLLALVTLAYYGEPEVMSSLGYQPEPIVARGRAVRLAEARW